MHGRGAYNAASMPGRLAACLAARSCPQLPADVPPARRQACHPACQASQPASLLAHWPVSLPASASRPACQVSYEVVFVPDGGEACEVQKSKPGEYLKAEDSVASGEYSAPAAGEAGGTCWGMHQT